MIGKTIEFIRQLYDTEEFIPLHEPRFYGNEKEYLLECIDSTFVSSVGKFVDQFEEQMVAYTGAKHAIATANGTAALHISLKLAGVESGDEVITQPLTFVATCNAIKYLGAHPVFVDVDKDTLGISPEKLENFLKKNTKVKGRCCYNKRSKRKIKAVVPMHTFGHPAKLQGLLEVCQKYQLEIIEDAAESLGSFFKGKHTGTFGLFGTLSFNGNKTITTGGGGMILTNDTALAVRAKHITTTAKVPHKWDFVHDEVAFNYRLPNINAALGCAQLEQLPLFIKRKREQATAYNKFFGELGVTFLTEPAGCQSNYWLNAIILEDENERDVFLKETNQKGVMTRPIWKLMNHLNMFSEAQSGDLENSEWFEKRVVNIPSSVLHR